MNRRRIYIALLVLLLILVTVRNINLFTSEEVRKGTVEGDYPAEWYSIISKEVNRRDITLVVDGKQTEINRNRIVMDGEGRLFIPVSALTEAFSCAARLYDESTRLVIEKNDTKVEIFADSGLTSIEGVMCIPIDVVERGLSYESEWDGKAYRLTMTSQIGEQKILPSAYDYREEGRAPRVKNQGTLGTCWAFASLMALESRLLPEERFDFSEDHMSLKNSFHMDQNDGGEYTMSMAYLLAWQGPVLESQDTYGDEASPEGLKPSKHVQTIEVLPAKDYEEIKKAIFFYGGVQSSLYTSMVTGQSDSKYYNKEKGAYCYIGSVRPNHDVVIIGWDDHYSKENFVLQPEGDGAFICANSWGGEFGDEGYFYVSYYDTNIGIHNVLYKDVNSTDQYDKIYQTDLCGWIGQLGYGKENAYFANVYQAEVEEDLTAAGFYATGADTEYEVYTVTDVNGSDSFTKRMLAAKGTVKNSGYYTIEFDRPVRIKAGERFAVIVSIKTPESVHPVAIEYNAPDKKARVDLSDGEGYISFLGSTWERVEEKQSSNVCLKAYTKEVE